MQSDPRTKNILLSMPKFIVYCFPLFWSFLSLFCCCCLLAFKELFAIRYSLLGFSCVFRSYNFENIVEYSHQLDIDWLCLYTYFWSIVKFMVFTANLFPLERTISNSYTKTAEKIAHQWTRQRCVEERKNPFEFWQKKSSYWALLMHYFKMDSGYIDSVWIEICGSIKTVEMQKLNSVLSF